MAPARTASAISSLALTFLGTASAQPSATRNHSALALRLGGDVWLFDCGEATQHQIQRSSIKMGRIRKIFITHTHGDHIFGLLPLLASRLNGAGGTADGVEDPRTQVPLSESQDPLEIYGPRGTRAYVRTGLTYTHTICGGPYVVHELLFPSDPPPESLPLPLPPHPSELPAGRDIRADAAGVWPAIFADERVRVSAAPIAHSVPCVGYVVHEAPVPGKINPALYVPAIKRAGAPMSLLAALQRGEDIVLPDGTTLHGPARRPGRTVAILGDTHDPSAIAALAAGADVLVHEATNAHLPGVDLDTKADDTFATVEARTKSRGHSTPQMAGAFARSVGARRLVLNHFSARYRGDDDKDEGAAKVMQAIRALAVEAYGSEEVVCARDFMTIDVEFPKP